MSVPPEPLPPDLATALGASAGEVLDFVRLRAGLGTLLGESYVVARPCRVDLVWRRSSLDAWTVEREVREVRVARETLRTELRLRLGSGEEAAISLGYREDQDAERVLASAAIEPKADAASPAPIEEAPRIEAHVEPEPPALEGLSEKRSVERTPDLDQQRTELLGMLDRSGRALALLEARKVATELESNRRRAEPQTLALAWARAKEAASTKRADDAKRAAKKSKRSGPSAKPSQASRNPHAIVLVRAEGEPEAARNLARLAHAELDSKAERNAELDANAKLDPNAELDANAELDSAPASAPIRRRADQRARASSHAGPNAPTAPQGDSLLAWFVLVLLVVTGIVAALLRLGSRPSTELGLDRAPVVEARLRVHRNGIGQSSHALEARRAVAHDG